MTHNGIEKVKQERQRLKQAMDELQLEPGYIAARDGGWSVPIGKASGKVRRASLDLSRALSEMRKSGR